MRSLYTIGLIAALTLTGCQNTPTSTVSDQDIASAQSLSDLKALYTQLASDLTDKDFKKYAQEYSQLDKLGARIAKEATNKIKTKIAASKLNSGLVPLNVLKESRQKIEAIATWHNRTAEILNDIVNVQIDKTTIAINEQKSILSKATDNNFEIKAQTLKSLTALTGDPSYQNQHQEMLDQLSKQFNTAQSEGDFEQAKELLAMLPKDENTKQRRIEIDTKLFEKRFNQALENDRPDEAYQHFSTLAQSEDFPEIKLGLKDTGKVMADYFTALASEASESGNVIDAYRWLSQAKNIGKHLDLPSRPSTDDQQFINLMQRGYQHSLKEKLHGVALGYLYAIEELQPNYPSLRRLINEAEKTILKTAIKKVSTTSFKSTSSKHDFGDTISAKITQYLFDNIPNDIRIIEREQYAAIQREQQLKGANSLDSVDFIITGSVLESKVDTSEKKGRKTMRVITEKGVQKNPAHASWAALTIEQKKLKPEPEKLINFEKKEDITTSITVHRKVGIFSVSYRLIDSSSGKVIFPDSITLHKEFQDESTEGVELGDFSIPFKLADLPSDIEILDTLATEITLKIGSKLVEKLQNPEDRYNKMAQRFIEAGNYIDASTQLGYAVTLGKQKDKNIQETKNKLKRNAIATGYSN